MFDFSGLKAVSANDDDEKYSFVGIRNGALRLPKGCKAWEESINLNKEPDKKFAAMQDTFLSLYRTLRAYRQAKNVSLTNDRDGVQQGGKGGQKLTLGSYEEDGNIVSVIYYRHLDMLDSILEAYDELAILSLAQRIGRSERLDYSKLHQHLERATFLEDDSFVVDEMMLPRQQVSFEPVEIVQMYCFVLLEIKKWLDEDDDVAPDIRVLAEQFFEHHLATGDSLFKFETWERTRNILRERLGIIDQNTAYKDEAYHDFYDALECFLWGNMQPSKDGIQWGISTFAPVWESMCLSYLIEDRLPEIAACDTSSLPDELKNRLALLTEKEESDDKKVTASLRVTKELSNVFKVNGVQLFPDCVLKIRFLDNYRNLLYKEYDVKKLADDPATTKRIPKDHYEIWQGLKDKTNGTAQRDAGQRLFALTGNNIPDNWTAFLLGRALSGSCENESGNRNANKFIESKNTNVTSLINKDIGTPFHLNLLRGMVWEVYFNKDDEFRDIDSIKRRKSLCSYNFAMECIQDVKEKNPKSGINVLYEFTQLAEAVIKSKNIGQSTIIDFKYLTTDYFHDPKNAADIRTRSVRKQFVYEYLLNEKLDKPAERYSIGSEFWIPGFDEDHKKIELSPDEQFLGGSIPLRRLNVAALMDAYCKLAAKEVEIAYFS